MSCLLLKIANFNEVRMSSWKKRVWAKNWNDEPNPCSVRWRSRAAFRVAGCCERGPRRVPDTVRWAGSRVQCCRRCCWRCRHGRRSRDSRVVLNGCGSRERHKHGDGWAQSPANVQPLANPAQSPVIPSDWVSKPGRTPGSTVYYPPGSPITPGSTYIRVMPPGSTPVPGLENGYWVSIENGQPINPASGGTGPKGHTHIPLPPPR